MSQNHEWAPENWAPVDTVQKILAAALQKGGEHAEFFLEEKSNNSILLDEKKIKRVSSGITRGAGIRVIKGDESGYAYSEVFTEEALLEAANVAATIANQKRDVTPVKITPRKAPRNFEITAPPYLAKTEDKIKLVTAASDTAYAYNKQIIQADVSYMDENRRLFIADSDGFSVKDVQELTRMYIKVTATNGELTQSAIRTSGGRADFKIYDKETPQMMAEECSKLVVMLLNADEAPAGELPVVIAPGEGGTMIHEAVGHGFEGDFIYHNTSVYAGRVNEKVASELITIIDDATIPNLRGSFNIDDEGTDGQKTVLVENGVLKGYMTDKISAKMLKLSPTGNGRRESYKHAPMPRMTNTYIGNGTTPPEEIIASISKGFYAAKLGGGQVDITSGNFVFTVTEGYLIENGKITRPVRGATLIGNGPDILTKVEMVGNDLKVISGGTCGKGQWVPVGDGMPTIKISKMTVGGMQMG